MPVPDGFRKIVPLLGEGRQSLALALLGDKGVFGGKAVLLDRHLMVGVVLARDLPIQRKGQRKAEAHEECDDLFPHKSTS